jgi:cellulose synthase/poly-beta-1,6-N-acetylglucosamine synthase-like glycosyltransferase
MEQVFAVAVLILSIAYAAPLLLFSVGFIRSRRMSAEYRASESYPSVSVVIAARNEESTIGVCLDSIARNDYPRSSLEIIVVDDGSLDGTVTRVREFEERLAGGGDPLTVKVVPSDPVESGHKKSAIRTGVECARGEIILLTDADGRVGPFWIRAMITRMDEKTGFVAGPVQYSTDGSFLSRLIALEFLGFAAISAGSIGMRCPVSCSGKNIAYRRDAFLAVGGYEGIDHLASGDDEFMMQRIADRTSWRIRFCMDREAIVMTEPPKGTREFLNQRIRWASKAGRYERRSVILLNVFLFSFLLSLPLLLIAAAFNSSLWPVLGLVLLVKIGAESSLLVQAAIFFRQNRLLKLILPAQPFHVGYVLYAVLAGSFGSFEWKSRTLTG